MPDEDDPLVLETFRKMAVMQAQICRINVDRTLATWTRTALALVVFGTVVDRYGILLLRPHFPHVGTLLAPNPLSSTGGIFLVAMGIFIAAATAIRHEAYRRAWVTEHGEDVSLGPWLASTFAAGATVFGVAMLVLLLVFAK